MDLDCDMSAQHPIKTDNDLRGDGVGFTVPTDRDWHNAVLDEKVFQFTKAVAHLTPNTHPNTQRASDVVWSFFCACVGEGVLTHVGDLAGALLDSGGFALSPAQTVATLSEPCGGPFPFCSAVGAILNPERPGDDARMAEPELIAAIVKHLVLDPDTPQERLSLCDIIGLVYPNSQLRSIPGLGNLAFLLNTHPQLRLPLASVVRYAHIHAITPRRIASELLSSSTPFPKDEVSRALVVGAKLSADKAAYLVWQATHAEPPHE